jgi:hypothetical protein
MAIIHAADVKINKFTYVFILKPADNLLNVLIDPDWIN